MKCNHDYQGFVIWATIALGAAVQYWQFVKVNKRSQHYASASYSRTLLKNVEPYTESTEPKPEPLGSSKTIKVSPRVFPKWNGTSLPCFDPAANYTPGRPWTDQKNLKRPAKSGLFFLKLLKTASTTGASIHLRIARNLAKRRNNSTICATRHLHGWAGPRMYRYGQRNRSESILWALVREPTTRYVSEFFHFQVSRKQANLSTAVEYLQSGPHSDHHYLSWLSTTSRFNRKRQSRRQQLAWVKIADKIMKDYDFIGISERLDESAVVLSMLLDIPLADVLFLSSKTSGGYDDGLYQSTCIKIQKPHVTPQLQEYLQSDEWLQYIEPELQLYAAVNASLDATIAALDKEEFQTRLYVFREAQKVALRQCAPTVKWPCSPTGERRQETDCLHRDMGCGFDCLDQVATELNLW